ncbi:MAG: PAS domain S-box protein, partial [Gaiellales bacterium]
AVQAMRAGGDYYLSKSSNFAIEVPLVIQEVLDKRRLRSMLVRIEDRYRRLIENMTDIVYELDEAGCFQYLSRAITELLGFLPDEMLGAHYGRLFHPEDLPGQGRQFHERRTGLRATRRLEVRLRNKLGEFRHFEVSAAGVYDRRRRFRATAGIARDCTARKQAERSLTQALSLLRATLESTSDGILALDHTGRVQIANGRFLRTWGIADALLASGDGLRMLDVIAAQVKHPFTPPELQHTAALDPEAETLAVWDLHDGRIIECSTQPQRVMSETVGRVWSFREVTAQKHAEATLKHSENLSRDLCETAPGIYCVLDTTGRITSINHRGAAQLGWTVEELCGQPFDLLVYPEDRPRMRAVFEQMCTTGLPPVGLEIRKCRKDGSLLWTSEEFTLACDAQGTVRSVRSMCRDISRHRQLEAQLLQAQKMEAIGQLAGGIAHDFNNLLTPILGYAQRLVQTLPEGSRQVREAGMILESASRAAQLTAQLLAFSRQQVAEPKVLDVNRHVAMMEGLLRRTIGEQVQLSVELAQDLGPVKADPSQLEQVILNLVLNARDAMPMGGKLTLRTSNVELSEERLTGVAGGRCVKLSIVDTGEGITSEIQSRMFEPFFTTKSVGKGTGLGLAIVDGIIKRSGGFIEVESVVGRGTAFHVYLPWAEGAPTEAKETVPSLETFGGTETILLVEDDETVRGFLADMLKGLGYTVLTAGNGAEAIEREAAYPGTIDMLISDIVMPKMSGWELVRVLRRHRPSLPVLFISGYPALPENEKMVLSEEVNLLRKPFAVDSLAQRVRQILNER